MIGKYFIFLVIFSIVTKFAECMREPREYGEPLPATGKTTVKIGTTNLTRPNITPKSSQQDFDSWEPLACTQCPNDRYFAHYLAQGCKPVDNGLFCKKPCPKYFECPKKEVDVVVEGCLYKGKVYKLREKIEHDNPCKKGCFCNNFVDTKNITNWKMTCAVVDCFGNLRAPSPNNYCFNVYEADKCCPREKCLNSEQIAQGHKCLYHGKQYHLEQVIYPEEDPCLECVCDQNWNQNNPLNSTSCRRVNCNIRTEDRLKAGCIPIYHEKTCCPISYHCPPPKEEQCIFDGKTYSIGENLHINEDRTNCTCLIPPVFTCIKKSVEESKPEYIKKFQTLPKINITNNPFANIPDLTLDSKCPQFIPGGLACAGTNCTTIINKNGCQACQCERPCPLLKCKEGCGVFATTPGVCPQCKCD